MDVTTLVTILILAGIITLLVRIVAGYTVAGCLTTYGLACVGAIGGWIAQQRLVGADNLLVIPWRGDARPVSIVGATIGALILALFTALLTRSLPTRRRSRH